MNNQTNLLLKDDTGCGYSGVGQGETIEEALENTILCFLKMISEKESFSVRNFECADPFNF